MKNTILISEAEYKVLMVAISESTMIRSEKSQIEDWRYCNSNHYLNTATGLVIELFRVCPSETKFVIHMSMFNNFSSLLLFVYESRKFHLQNSLSCVKPSYLRGVKDAVSLYDLIADLKLVLGYKPTTSTAIYINSEECYSISTAISRFKEYYERQFIAESVNSNKLICAEKDKFVVSVSFVNHPMMAEAVAQFGKSE